MQSKSDLWNPRFPVDVANAVSCHMGEDVDEVLEVFFERAKVVPEQTYLLPTRIVTDTLPDTKKLRQLQSE